MEDRPTEKHDIELYIYISKTLLNTEKCKIPCYQNAIYEYVGFLTSNDVIFDVILQTMT